MDRLYHWESFSSKTLLYKAKRPPLENEQVLPYGHSSPYCALYSKGLIQLQTLGMKQRLVLRLFHSAFPSS